MSWPIIRRTLTLPYYYYYYFIRNICFKFEGNDGTTDQKGTNPLAWVDRSDIINFLMPFDFKHQLLSFCFQKSIVQIKYIEFVEELYSC